MKVKKARRRSSPRPNRPARKKEPSKLLTKPPVQSQAAKSATIRQGIFGDAQPLKLLRRDETSARR